MSATRSENRGAVRAALGLSSEPSDHLREPSKSGRQWSRADLCEAHAPVLLALDCPSSDPHKIRVMINRGDLYWIASDASRDDVAGVAHPHVVIQDDVLNHSRIHTVVVCALTSNLKRATEPGNVLLDPGEGNLEKQSVVVVSQVSSVPKAELGVHIGALSTERVGQILAGLRFQQASFFNR